MSQWLEQVIARGEQANLTGPRLQALTALKQQRWPTRKSEAWRYTSVTPVEQLELSTESAAPASPTKIAGLDSLDLVFIDGVLQQQLNTLSLPEGLTIQALTTLNTEEHSATALFAQIKPAHHLFGLVNDVLAEQGLIINVAPGADITLPVRIINLSSQGKESHVRVVVRLGEQARLCVIEQGEGQDPCLHTYFAEYQIGAQAHLEHYRLALHTGKALQVGGNHFRLLEKAQLSSTLVAFGSDLSRLDVDIEHAGEHAKAKFNAIYLLGTGETFDLHSCIEHAVPNGTTEENARGIVGDRAKAVFNGRIHIHRHAQKTLAELNNRNLLLSRRGQINTKPELEIYADDVKCAHGATVAEIEEKALYYLLSRGISRSQALIMLNFGFIQELINEIPNAPLANWLHDKLRHKFSQMEVK
ncbi:Fe-S cluster assembly protein SufD [Bowmanella yangjiangensis]|uniref:Fe-S cluster assembly protein SufD n=1 Tax=Bowmanella yangjiangensis TaxID=2811230 RepID=A0ABS3CQF9_9ALTE|nr:Fe-S cluster assembly protein SufD [Bowmanella yangjiangensis]MBN7818789.1 Fe-S cluster assembly protein SufD [Bowmanella yangjiangensis]